METRVPVGRQKGTTKESNGEVDLRFGAYSCRDRHAQVAALGLPKRL